MNFSILSDSINFSLTVDRDAAINAASQVIADTAFKAAHFVISRAVNDTVSVAREVAKVATLVSNKAQADMAIVRDAGREAQASYSNALATTYDRLITKATLALDNAAITRDALVSATAAKVSRRVEVEAAPVVEAIEAAQVRAEDFRDNISSAIATYIGSADDSTPIPNHFEGGLIQGASANNSHSLAALIRDEAAKQ